MSSKSHKPIDYADIRLQLRGAVREAMSEAVQLFEEQHDHIEVTPRWRKDELLVNSTDLIAVLGYFNGSGLSEFEIRGLKKLIADQCEQALIRSLQLDAQSHYKWCLAAIKSLEWGRYL